MQRSASSCGVGLRVRRLCPRMSKCALSGLSCFWIAEWAEYELVLGPGVWIARRFKATNFFEAGYCTAEVSTWPFALLL